LAPPPEAPSKEFVIVDNSGHTPRYDEPAQFSDLMSILRSVRQHLHGSGEDNKTKVRLRTC